MSDTPEPTAPVELIWLDGTRHVMDVVPASPEDETIHVGDHLTCNGYRFLCLDEHDEPDGTHVVGVCLEEHYELITLTRMLDGQDVVVFYDEDAQR